MKVIFYSRCKEFKNLQAEILQESGEETEATKNRLFNIMQKIQSSGTGLSYQNQGSMDKAGG